MIYKCDYRVTGINDEIFNKYVIGSDVVEGPIKILCVPAGTLKYVIDIRTSYPILLGPGMHFFNDLNIQIPPGTNVIPMNSNGMSQVIKFGIASNYRYILLN